MNRNKETARRGNAGGKVNHQRREHNTAAARGARHGRRFGGNVGESIVIALAIGAGAGRVER
jgi:hypothetical protein